MENDNGYEIGTSSSESISKENSNTSIPSLNNSSLLERIRAKQSQRQSNASSSAPLATTMISSAHQEGSENKEVSNEDHPLLTSTDTETRDNESNEPVKNMSFLPSSQPLVPNNSQYGEDLQQSIFPSRSSTLKPDQDSSVNAVTNAYTYVSPPNPPMNLNYPLPKYHPHGNGENYNIGGTTTSAKIFNTIANTVSTMQDKMKYFSLQSHQNLDNINYNVKDSYQSDAPLILPGENEDGAMEYLHERGQNYQMRSNYSMKGYFITFCQDMYDLSIGRMSKYVQITIVALFVVFIFWFVIGVL